MKKMHRGRVNTKTATSKDVYKNRLNEIEAISHQSYDNGVLDVLSEAYELLSENNFYDLYKTVIDPNMFCCKTISENDPESITAKWFALHMKFKAQHIRKESE